MDTLFLFLALLVMATIGGLFLILSHSPAPQHASAKKIEGTDFLPSQMYMGNDGLGGIAVNERTHQICLFTSPTTSPRILPITDLLGSSIIKNGEVLGEGKRTHPQEMVLFIKELHPQKKSLIKSLHMGSSNNSNQRIDLFVVTHDQEEPILVVNFLDMETKEGGILFEKAMSTAMHWHYVLDGLILQADQSARVQSEMTQQDKAEVAP
jgi:hypothetical protein